MTKKLSNNSTPRARVVAKSSDGIGWRPFKRTTTSAPRARVIAKSSDENGWRPFKRTSLLVLLLVLGMMVLGAATEPMLVPAPLVGVWQSSSDKYANCFIEFSPVTITFGTADGGSALYFVSKVVEAKGSGEMVYLIDYRDLENVRYEMALGFWPGSDAVLYIKSQPKELWKKRLSE